VPPMGRDRNSPFGQTTVRRAAPSAMNNRFSPSTAMPVGVPSSTSFPVPSRTVLRAPPERRRILWLPLSAMYRVPAESAARPAGFSSGAAVAREGPVMEPDCPLPAMTRRVPSGVI
jgi:hypothetical protein